MEGQRERPSLIFQIFNIVIQYVIIPDGTSALHFSHIRLRFVIFELLIPIHLHLIVVMRVPLWLEDP